MNTMRNYAAVVLLLFPFYAAAQARTDQAGRIATFCKIWGFLKYYHPVVARGGTDWDQEFITRVKAIQALGSKQDVSSYYTAWIGSLGKVEACAKCAREPKDAVTYNVNLNWLTDQNEFTPELIAQLEHIRKNRNLGDNFYVSKAKGVGNTLYENEKAYADSIYPSQPMRLLALARYWNIINYFYPYKYKICTDWDTVLSQMAPRFAGAADPMAYHLLLLELVASINDSHAGLATVYTSQYFGLKQVPFKCKIIDGKAIVTGFIDESLCQKNDIRYGDVFLAVNGTPVEAIMSNNSKYISASNPAVKNRNFLPAIFNGQTSSFSATFERDGTIAEKTVNRYLYSAFAKAPVAKADTSKLLEGNIGYVNMGVLEQKDVARTLKKLERTQAIIFDVRNYPKGTMYEIANFLKPGASAFAKFTTPNLDYPGMYGYTSPIYCGNNNKQAYSGKVILLFNEQTQSHAEFTLMALQTAPNVISIGSQTAGADGNVSLITLPGNIKTYMTGIGVFYPDGRETQRIGIVPDIEVKPSIAGIRQKRDEVLEKALEVAKGN